MNRVLFEMLFEIIIIALFMMWCTLMWDKKVIENIKVGLENMFMIQTKFMFLDQKEINQKICSTNKKS